LGIGDWGMGIGARAIHNPQSPKNIIFNDDKTLYKYRYKHKLKYKKGRSIRIKRKYNQNSN